MTKSFTGDENIVEKMLSVVIPVYNEDKIAVGIDRVVGVLEGAGIPWEIILVDDGSVNDAWQQLEALAERYDGITAISFSRNFGKESALCAGLDHARGDCCVCLDADMQFPPEVIPEMYALWRDQGYEVVVGVKKKRQNESMAYRFCSNLFYGTLKKLSGIDLKNGSDFRLLDRVVVDAWKTLPEKQTFFRGMSSWVGFKTTTLEFDVADRVEGKSKWTLKGLARLAINAVTSYSAVPLYVSAFMGVLFFLFAFVMGIQTLFMYVSGRAQSGFTTVILLLLIIGGIILLGLGVIGIYIKKIYEEVKGRPRYIIRRKITGSNSAMQG